jgi:hypothetical protein
MRATRGRLVLTAFGVLALVGCSGKTTGATNITDTSATLRATVRCDSGESCRWYWEYWRDSAPRSISVKTPVAGPVKGPTGDVNLSVDISGLDQGASYRFVFCGAPSDSSGFSCVGPNGKVGSPTADPPPDYDTLNLAGAATLAERWNGTSWTLQNVPNQDFFNGLNDVSCTSSNACTAVGSSGFGNDATLAERWNGSTWTIQATPATSGNSHLYGVSCASSTACFAVGTNGTGPDSTGPLAERWDGSSWAIQSTAALPAGTSSARLDGISCTSSTACTAVGSYQDSSEALHNLIERWNGTSWTLQTSPATSFATLSGVTCISSTSCFAVGFGQPSALAERWNGTTWTLQSTPAAPGDAIYAALGRISCTSASACTAVGNYGGGASGHHTLIERWNGSSWAFQSTPQTSDLNGVACTSATACLAVGGRGGFPAVAERWDGTTWTSQPPPHPPEAASLNGLSCTAATACISVGTQ